MAISNFKEMGEYLYHELRLRTLPVATKFFEDEPQWSEKTRRPSEVYKKRITVCQAMTLARNYRWTVGLTIKDLICAPGMLVFGQTDASNPKEKLAKLFTKIGWCADEIKARQEVAEMAFMPRNRSRAMMLAPLVKGLYEPDTITIYGNPAQIMRLVQAWVSMEGALVKGLFGGKVSCSEYLIAPYLTGEVRVSLPGNGDRVFSTTQDDEMAFALPGSGITKLVEGLKKTSISVGARYPVRFYQNYQPEYPASSDRVDV